MSNDLVPILDLAMSRRMFLQGSAIMLGSVFLPGPLAVAQVCRPTEQDILGPFYRFNAPFRTKLADPGEAGERLIVSGTIYSSDCLTPLPETLIEVWQANKVGLYDTNTPGNFTERAAFRLRGMMLTDKQGRYELETIVPGRYPIPPGIKGLEKYAGMTRPAHIHFRISESLHVPLTTQLYFKDDPFIANDPWAGHKPSLAISLKQEGSYLRGVFDIVLARG